MSTGRVSFFTAQGVFHRSVTVDQGTMGSSLCVRNTGTMVLGVGGSPRGVLLELDARGRRLRSHGFPFPGVATGTALLTSVMAVRGQPAADCVFATTFGFGLIRVDATGRIITQPYIERVALPTVRQVRHKRKSYTTYIEKGEPAASGAFRAGDTVVVVVVTDAKSGERLLDRYDARGTYLGTWTTPPDGRFAYADAHLVGLSGDGSTHRVRAWAQAADTARLIDEYRASRGAGGATRPSRRADSRGRPAPPAPVPPRDFP